jgi:hypothetical protein
VQVARVVAVSRQVTPARRSGRFVGRDSELSALRDEWEKARKGTATFVALSGEAGAGKTRLVEEFRARIAANATWLEGRAYPFAQNIPYYAITDLISSRLGIDETDSAETVREIFRCGAPDYQPDGRKPGPHVIIPRWNRRSGTRRPRTALASHTAKPERDTR